MNKLAFLIPALLSAASLFAIEEDNTALRLNPHFEPEQSESTDYAARFGLNKNAPIIMNGADWSDLARKYSASAKDSLFNVVYLGDSHVQGGYSGAMLAEVLGKSKGNAGRGLLIPHRLAGTNQPDDYSISLSCPASTRTLMRTSEKSSLPFTGVEVRPNSFNHSFNISSDKPFSQIDFIYNGQKPLLREVSIQGKPVSCIIDGPEEASIILDRPTRNVTLTLESDSTRYGGFVVSNSTHGCVTHVLGNNGAFFNSYNAISNFGAQLACLHPDLVVVALGTNEAFGGGSSADIEYAVTKLVQDIRKHNSGAKILLVTPTESLRKTSQRVRTGRRRYKTVTNYSSNTRTASVRDAIMRAAQKNRVAVWDMYEIGGGANSARELQNAHILGSDGVHYTVSGYRISGTMLGEAILETLKNEASKGHKR